jgi:hypothetical protein
VLVLGALQVPSLKVGGRDYWKRGRAEIGDVEAGVHRVRAADGEQRRRRVLASYHAAGPFLRGLALPGGNGEDGD